MPDAGIVADIGVRMRGVKEKGGCPLGNKTQVPLPTYPSLLLLYLHHPPISGSILFLLHHCRLPSSPLFPTTTLPFQLPQSLAPLPPFAPSLLSVQAFS